MKYLPDSSAWIHFFRDGASSCAQKLASLIETEADVRLCGPVLTEVLQGIRYDAQYRKISKLLDEFDFIELKKETYREAARIYRACRSKGFTVRGPMDCIIAATAMINDCHLLHGDRDYDVIARSFPLKLV